MAEVNIESLSSQPLDTEEENTTPEVQQPDPVEGMQQAAQPAQTVEDGESIIISPENASRPLSQTEVQEIRQPTEGVSPAATAQSAREQEVEKLAVTPEAKPYSPSAAMAMPSFTAQRNLLKQKGQDYNYEQYHEKMNEVGSWYRDNVLSMNLPEGTDLASRVDSINNAYSVAPIINGAMGEAVPLANLTTEGKLVHMFEDPRLQGSNGQYVLIDNQNKPFSKLDIGLQQMQEDIQNPVGAFFSRTETEKGGLRKFVNVMRKANPKINPARLAYMAKKQAEAGAFSGIEGERTWGSLKDTLGFFANTGFALGDWALGEARGFGRAYNYIMGTPSEDMSFASPNQLVAAAMEKLPPEQRTPERMEAEYARVMEGKLSFPRITDSFDEFKKQYPDANENELRAMYSYSPDAFTTIKRFLGDSLVTGGGFVAISKKMAATERREFMEFVSKETGTKGITDPNDALEAIKTAKKDPIQLLSQFREQRGGAKLLSDFRARVLDHELGKTSVYKNDILDAEKTRLQDGLKSVQEKLKGIGDDRPKLKQNLLAQERNYEKQLRDFVDKRKIPPHYRDYFKDEAYATLGAGVTYQAIYDYAGYNETTSSIGSFLGALFVSSKKFRYGLGDSKEDFMALFKHGFYGDSAENARAARKAVRSLRNAPPQMKEEILMMGEVKAQTVEDLSKLKYPDDYPDPAKAGKPVLSEDQLAEGYYRMTGLLSLRALNAEIRKSSIDIQKDVGGHSKKLWELEQSYRQEQEIMSDLAQYVDAMRYTRMHPDFDPQSDAGIMINTLVDFYDGNTKRLADMEADFADAQTKTLNDIQGFFEGIARSDTNEALMKNETQLSDLLNVGWERHKSMNLPRDYTAEQEMDALQAFYAQVYEKIGNAYKQNADFTFNAEQTMETANNLFRQFIVAERARAYQEGHAAFNALRQSPAYKDARIDMTGMFDMLMKGGDGTAMYFDEKALSEIMPAYRKGAESIEAVESLPLLKFAGQQLNSASSTALRRMFSDGAGRYINELEQRGFGDELAQIFEDAELDEGAGALEKFVAFRNWYGTHGPSIDPDGNFAPVIGMDVTDFTHMIQGLGASNNKQAWQLRDELLERANTDFYNNFYDGKDSRISLDEFGADYANVREVWKKRVVVPFASMDSSVKKYAQDADLNMIDNNVFTNFMNKTLGTKKAVSINELKQPGGFLYEIEKIIGGPLDVSTPQGAAVKQMLNAYVQTEIARTPGAIALRRYLTDKGDLKGITPATLGKIARGIDESPTPLLDNLTRTDADGRSLFVDVNGVPLIDASNHRLLGIDDLVNFDVEEAVNATKRIDNDLKAITQVQLREMKDANSQVRKEIASREKLVSLLGGSTDLGRSFIDIAKRPTGMDELAALRGDFIQARVAAGDTADQAAALFDYTRREAVIEHIMNNTMTSGGKIPRRTTLPDGTTKVDAETVTGIDVNKLGDILGLRGTGKTASDQEKAMREALGDDVFDNMKMVYDNLYDPTVRTGALNVTGTSMPLSAESLLSRGTSFFRGVISLRWLISEAAIRKSRQNNYELTKLMLSNPKVGEEIMSMLISNRFDLDKRTPEFVDILLSQLAKNEAIQQYAAEMSGAAAPTPIYAESQQREEQQRQYQQQQYLNQMQEGMAVQP